MSIVLPPTEVFEITPNYESLVESSAKATNGYEGGGWLETILGKDGGIYLRHQGIPVLRKGHVYPHAIMVNNQVKRVTLALFSPLACKEMFLPMLMFVFLPFKTKISFLEKMLVHFTRLADSIYRSVPIPIPIPYLKEQYYKNLCKELWKFLESFLREIGISENTAHQTGKMLAMMIEYDDFYQYVIEDLFSETTKEKMLQNPRKEIVRLAQILKQRTTATEDTEVGGKFLTLFKALSFILLLPRVKKAFKNALEKIDFPKLQLDDADKYFCLISDNNYCFFGKTLKERKELIWDKAEEDFKSLMTKSMSEEIETPAIPSEPVVPETPATEPAAA